jgi:hypothetical protein
VGKIENQTTGIGRLSAQPVAAAAHRHWQVLLTRKTESMHDIIIALATHNHGWASGLIEDIAQLIICLTSGHNHFPRDAMGEFGEDVRIQ